MTTQLQPEQKQMIELEVLPIIQSSVIVKTQADRDNLARLVKEAKEARVKIEATFKPTENKKKARELYDSLLEVEHTFYDGIDEFIIAGTKNCKAFDTAEALRIQREAKELQDKEDQKAREEQARRDAEAAALIKAEEDRALAEFDRLEKEKAAKLATQEAATESGNVKVVGIAAKEVVRIDSEMERVQLNKESKIEEIKAAAEATPEPPAPKVKPGAAKAAKIVWKAKVTNQLKACQSIAEGLIPCNAVTFSQQALNDLGKTYVDGVTKIPGIEFVPDTNTRL